MSERKPKKCHHVDAAHHDRWVRIRNVLFHNKWILKDEFGASLDWMLDLAEKALWKDRELQQLVVRQRAKEIASENADVEGDAECADARGEGQVSTSSGVEGGVGGTEEGGI